MHLSKVCNVISKYTGRLNEMLRNPVAQKEIIQYVYNCLQFTDLCLFKRIRSKIKRQFKIIENITFEQLAPHKNNKESIYYWLIMFKDSRIQFLKGLKPPKPTTLHRIYPNAMVSQVEPLIPLWIASNPTLYLYVIKITFYLRADTNINIQCKNDSVKDFVQYQRCLDTWGNPCVIR